MIVVRALSQTAWLALTQIWANKFRAVLTTLGIIIAVTAVVSIIALMTGFKDYVLTEFQKIGTNKVWVFPRRPEAARDRYSWRQIRITREQVDGMLVNCPSLARLSPVMEMTQQVQHADRVRDLVRVQGIRGDWHEIEQRFVTVGRTFGASDESERLQVCLVNDKGLEELDLPRDPTGRTILVGGRRFVVVGVVETTTVSPMFGGNEPRTEVFIPFATAESMRPFGGMYVVAQSRSPELFEDVKAEVTFYMRKVRSLGPGEPNTFGVEALDQFISQFKKLAAGATAVVGVLVGISLLVGGIGIMNIMLVSVSERTREIGLRKALGARPGIILMQFLVEAVVLCLVGGVIGLLIGQGIVVGARLIPDSPMKGAFIPAWAVGLAMVFSAGTGILFGMFPAVKAARLDPIVALRHD